MKSSLQSKVNIVRVAIPSPLRKKFDYLLPVGKIFKEIKIGTRVIVPFGRRTLVGVIWELAEHSKIGIEKLKPIIEIIDDQSLFSESMIDLINWASNYYHHPIGDVVANVLPTLLRQGKPVEVFDEIKVAPINYNSLEKLSLNKYQQLAVDSIIVNSGFKTFLLDGVTGSGKTEVYMRVIEQAVQDGKQALVLVPEIGLTPQLVDRFKKRFSSDFEDENNIAVFHSKLTPKERLKCWIRAKNNLVSIVIGTRSALFTPLANLGVIILDEEHDLSFKQQTGFRYSARDLALIRAKLENVAVILGSATPSFESLYNALLGKHTHLQLPERVGLAINPVFHLIDMRNKRVVHGVSEVLCQKIQMHLINEGQVLLFLNRRGYAPTLICQSCGWIAKCNRCDARMTLHQQPKHLYCHHCGSSWSIIAKCADCNSENLISLGVGTERLEEVLQEKFPGVSIMRIDGDTTKRKNQMQEMLEAVQNNKCRILIGTQMLAKGHHFPDVTMVGIINADVGLLSSDFRASEHIAQLITQVAGRAGRAEKSGEVYIQTYNPEHPLLLSLIHKGYGAFFADNLQERKITNLPPFSYMTLLRAESKIKDLALKILAECKDLLFASLNDDVRVLGPVPNHMYRKSGYYRAQLLITSCNRKKLHDKIELIIKTMEQLKSSSKVRWAIEVDPLEIL